MVSSWLGGVAANCLRGRVVADDAGSSFFQGTKRGALGAQQLQAGPVDQQTEGQ